MSSISEKDVSDKSVKEKTNELRAKYPIFTAILERIPVMDLKEVVSVMLFVDPIRWLLRTHAMKLSLMGQDEVTDRMVEEKINELRAKNPIFGGVLERIHKMDLKETTVALFGIDGMESLLKLRALVILSS
jgi:hypothetical protein